MKERKKTVRKLSVLVLCVALIFSFTVNVSAAADPGKVIKSDWTNFRGNAENNAVTNAKVPKEASKAMLYWATKKRIWMGICGARRSDSGRRLPIF